MKASKQPMVSINPHTIDSSKHTFSRYILFLLLFIMAGTECNILTWNVRGIMSSASSLSKLLDDKNIDIAFISEHKVREQQDTFLNSVHSIYSAFTLCDASVGPSARCGKGGVAIMYRKSCQFTISPLNIHINDIVVGIQIDCKYLRPIYAFSLYLPSVNYSYEDYAECIDSLQVLYDTFSESGLRLVLFCGDFNCDIYKPAARDNRLQKLLDFMEYTNMQPVTPTDQYTFRPTCKVLDYNMIDKNRTDLILKSNVINDDICHVSDHLPILTVMKCELVEYNLNNSRHVAWNKCSNEQLLQYKHTLEQELEHVKLPEHCCAADVDIYYEYIVNAIHKAADATLPHSKFNKHAKPYWTPEVSAAHREQRNKRREWIEQGNPRHQSNAFFAAYKEAKSRFRKLQKAAIANVELKYYIDLDASATCDMRYFWHLVNRRRKIKCSSISKIKSDSEVLNCPDKISDAFAASFADLFTPKDTGNFDSDFKIWVESKVESFKTEQSRDSENLSCPVEVSEIVNNIKELKRRKSPGPDDVSNEHIIHGGPVLAQCLKTLFDKMFELDHIPSKFKIGIIIPVHKPGKCRDSTESYRPITLVSTLYKLFERILHSRLKNWSSQHDKTFPSPQQNAYQKHMGSITASFNLQETIAHNIELGSNCYVAFLDAAKAFDNVWHDGLFFQTF